MGGYLIALPLRSKSQHKLTRSLLSTILCTSLMQRGTIRDVVCPHTLAGKSDGRESQRAICGALLWGEAVQCPGSALVVAVDVFRCFQSLHQLSPVRCGSLIGKAEPPSAPPDSGSVCIPDCWSRHYGLA